MSAPDPEGLSLLAKVLIAGTAVVTPIWGFLKLWDKKADKHTVRNDFQRVEGEQAIHRKYFEKAFEKMEEHARRDEQLFREVMNSIGDNHAELLRELGRKEDRK